MFSEVPRGSVRAQTADAGDRAGAAVALLGAMLTAGYQASIGGRLDGVPESRPGPPGRASRPRWSPPRWPGRRPVTWSGPAQEAFVDGWQRSLWAGAAATALLLAYLIARGPRGRTAQDQFAAEPAEPAEPGGPSVVPVPGPPRPVTVPP